MIGIDDSEASSKALDTALEWGAKDDQYILLHVVLQKYDEMWDDLEARKSQQLKEVYETVCKDKGVSSLD